MTDAMMTALATGAVPGVDRDKVEFCVEAVIIVDDLTRDDVNVSEELIVLSVLGHVTVEL